MLALLSPSQRSEVIEKGVLWALCRPPLGYLSRSRPNPSRNGCLCVYPPSFLTSCAEFEASNRKNTWDGENDARKGWALSRCGSQKENQLSLEQGCKLMGDLGRLLETLRPWRERTELWLKRNAKFNSMALKPKSSCVLFFPFLPFPLGPSKNTKANGLASAVSMQQDPLFTSIESFPWS